MLPPDLRAVLAEDTAAAWPKVVAALPPGGYLVGGTALAVHLHHRVSRDLDVFVDRPFDTAAVRAGLEHAGHLTVTTFTEDTLNGMLDGTKVQFLEAASHRLLDPPVVVAAMPVAGIRDLMADKLKVVRDRGELRDYFDLMSIEQAGTHRCEQGLAYYLDRYGLGPDDTSLSQVVMALGFLDDVADDPGLPVGRGVIEDYWRTRQPELLRSLASLSHTHGLERQGRRTADPPTPPPALARRAAPRCGAWMPRARTHCVRRPGHRGGHRSR